jgi:hypothetical protein
MASVRPAIARKLANSKHYNFHSNCTASRMMGRRRYASTALLALTASVQSYSAVFVPRPLTSSTRGLLGIPRGGSTAKDPMMAAKIHGNIRTSSSSSSSSLSQSATVEPATDSMASSTMTAAAKLEMLRSKMKELDLDVYLVPSGDPHLSGKRMNWRWHCCFC